MISRMPVTQSLNLKAHDGKVCLVNAAGDVFAELSVQQVVVSYERANSLTDVTVSGYAIVPK